MGVAWWRKGVGVAGVREAHLKVFWCCASSLSMSDCAMFWSETTFLNKMVLLIDDAWSLFLSFFQATVPSTCPTCMTLKPMSPPQTMTKKLDYEEG